MNRMILGAILFLICTVPAFAVDSWTCADNETSCDPYAPPMPESGGKDWFGLNAYYCEAESRWGQYCVDAVWNPDTKVTECRNVLDDAHCGCNKKTFSTVGLCDQKH